MHVLLAALLLLGAVRPLHAAPDCDGAWIKRAKVNVKKGRLDVQVSVVRPGVTHDTLVGPGGLQLELRDLASGTTVQALDVPQAAFVTRGKRTRATGDTVPGTITLSQAAGQADAVSVRVQLGGVTLPEGAFDLRAELESDGGCARSCVSACAPGRKNRVRCTPSMAYRPFDDLGFGDFTGSARKRPKTTSMPRDSKKRWTASKGTRSKNPNVNLPIKSMSLVPAYCAAFRRLSATYVMRRGSSRSGTLYSTWLTNSCNR